MSGENPLKLKIGNVCRIIEPASLRQVCMVNNAPVRFFNDLIFHTHDLHIFTYVLSICEAAAKVGDIRE